MPLAEPRWRDSKLCAGSCGTRLARTAQRGVITERDGKFADSPLEEAGFEPSVPREAAGILVISVLVCAHFSACREPSK